MPNRKKVERTLTAFITNDHNERSKLLYRDNYALTLCYIIIKISFIAF